MIDALIRARYGSFLVVLALLAGLLAFGKHVQYEQSITSFFAEGDPDVLAYQTTSDLFGNDNLVFIAYDDPDLLTPNGMDRVAELAGAVGPARIDGVLSVQSIDAMPLLWEIDDKLVQLESLPPFLKRAALAAARSMVKTVGQPGSVFTVGGAIHKADARGLAALKARLLDHPLFRGTVIDDHGEGTTTALVVRLKGMADLDPKAVVRDLRLAADSFAERHHLNRPALVGPPVLLADGFTSIELDGRRLAVVGMLLIGLVTLTMTWSLWWSVVPILAGWVVWLAAETIMASLGLRLSLSGGPLVAQIIVLTMPAASHLASHFRDELRGSADRLHAARHTLRVVSAPILWCAVTGAIGYGALVTSNVVPIRQFGLILGVCTLTAAVLTMLISPVAMRPPFRLEITVRPGSTSRLSTVLNQITVWVERHPLPIVVSALAIALPLTLGMFRLQYESNYINAFEPRTRIVQDYRTIEARLGGIGVVSLVVPSGKKITPETIRSYERLDDQILDLRQGDGERAVSHVLSLATVLDPEGRLAALPPEQFADALATKLELIELSPQADLLGNFWNPEGGWARMMMRVSERQPAPVKEATFAQGLALVRSQEFFGPRSYLTGLSFLLTQTTRGVMATSWTTFLWTAASILLMLTIAFGGPKLASLALLPTLLAVGLVLGLSGWLGVKLDIATALVASVALGLSVDDTFHCLLQFRRLRRELPFREALLASYAVSGPGVLLSSLAVALGFAVLRFSEFVPFSNFGAMVGVATLGSSLGNLLLLPACLALGHRWSERPAREVSSPVEVETP